MNTPNTAIKILALSGFSLLVIGFTAYKAGFFNAGENPATVRPAGTLSSSKAETRDSVILPGSKSLILSEPLHYDLKIADEPEKTSEVPAPVQDYMISSSKSAVIAFDTPIFRFHLSDSLMSDSLQKP